VHKWIEAYYKSSNPNFKKNVVLIGNKIDLEEQREVNKEDAENYAKDNDMIYWETSAKDGNNVEEVFHYIAKYLYDNFKGEFTQSAMSNSLLKDNDKGGYSDLTGKCC
ncbi:MAG: hypothetical protein MJ252_25105, partial [archaeon]|nr:hypothetical protein [archaeon]